MANEIDLWKDLEYCDKVLKRKDLDEVCRPSWEKERANVLQELKDNYPDMFWDK